MPVLEREFERYANEFRFSRGIPEFIGNMARFKNCTLYDEKHSMTNSEKIDPVLEQVRVVERSFLGMSLLSDTRLYNSRLCRLVVQEHDG